MAYLLDANVFIKAKNDEYGFEICPGFWDWLDDANTSGKVLSIEHVRDELLAHDDDLAKWTSRHGADFFQAPDEVVVARYAELSRWATAASQYTPAAKAEFVGSGADAYLVAQAMAYGHTVVTHEQPDSKKNRIKIPEAAITHGVKCIRPYQMLRAEHARFVLERPK